MIRFFIKWIIWVRHFRYLKAGPEFTWFQLICELRGVTSAFSNTPKYYALKLLIKRGPFGSLYR